MNRQIKNTQCIYHTSDVVTQRQQAHSHKVLEEHPIPPPSPMCENTVAVKRSDSKQIPSISLDPSSFSHLRSTYSGDQMNPRQRRRVTFGNRIRIREVRHRNEISTEILEAAWLSTQDYSNIREVLKRTIRLMMEGQVVDNDPRFEGLSSRGLETRTLQGQANRNQRRSSCRQAVLSEQAHQRRVGAMDTERIAAMSSIQSAWCVMEAQNKALMDAREARK